MDERPRMGGGACGRAGGRGQAEARVDGVRVATDGGTRTARDGRGWTRTAADGGATGGDGSAMTDDGRRDGRPEEERGLHRDGRGNGIRDGRKRLRRGSAPMRVASTGEAGAAVPLPRADR